MIFDLATREAKEGAKIDVPQLLPDKKNHVSCKHFLGQLFNDGVIFMRYC